MRINNVSSITSIRDIVVSSAIVLLFVIAFVVLFCFFTPMQLFQAFLGIEDVIEKLYVGFLVLILPLLLIWSLISQIKSRNEALEHLSHGLNLKYVDFLQGRIHFKFTDSKYDFVCGYNDVEQIKMDLNTTIVHTKNGSYVALKEIQINFHVLNGKIFSISNIPLRPAKFLYKFIDYTRSIQNFSYRFTGAGEVDDLKERIDDYRKRGCKQILSTPQENSFKYISIVFFAISVFFIFSFWHEITQLVTKRDFGILIMFSPVIILTVISLVLDGFLIADKINDRKFHLEHTSKEFIGKIPCEFIIAVQFIVLVVFAFLICKPLIFSINDNKILKANSGFEELWINPQLEFNNMRKDEIYDIRKAYVKDSLFALENYEPNERVFGAIEDYKPWWGEQECRPLNYTGDYHESIEGKSKQSVQINNPNALVGLSSPYIPWDVERNADFCNSEYSKFIPKVLKYSEKDNLIVAEYEVSKEFLNILINISGKNFRYPIQLSGLNALDFGYKYVYAFDTKNIEMLYSNNNVTQTVEKFRDYIHVGGSCGYEGGCNNISPMQNDKMITVVALPAEINLKLWKKQPYDKYSKADMYYRIIFKEQ